MEHSPTLSVQWLNAIRIFKTLACVVTTFIVAPIMATAAEPAPTFETPILEHVLTVRASIDAMVTMGKTPEGERRMVPITGGTFEGSGMKGTIMPGGEDWQLTREDGVTQLDARYWLKTEDGVIIRVHNQVLSVPPPPGAPPTQRYGRSTVRFEAPIGKYDWLNKAIFIGTIAPDITQRPQVIVLRFFRVN